MATLNNKLFDLKNDIKELTKLTKDAWSEMMQWACIKALTKFRFTLLLFVSELGDSGKVKKHTKRLQGFMAELKRLEDLPLNSKTYIKQILVPLKGLREEFETFKKGSILNTFSETKIELIELQAERQAEETLKAA